MSKAPFVLKSHFDMKSLEKKLKKVADSYNESQEQAVKRWGVSTCRVLAIRTQAFGKSSAAKQKKAMWKDGRRVLFTHKGTAKPSKTGRSMVFKTDRGGKSGVRTDKYLTSIPEINRWIQKNRTGRNRRTVKLPPEEKKVCSDAMFKKAIAKKHKETAGMAKDGWLDAGDKISKRQKGKKPVKIGAGFMGWARKPQKLGSAKESKRRFRSVAHLINHLSYSSLKYVLKQSDKNRAIQDGLTNTLQWYKFSIRAENKKKK